MGGGIGGLNIFDRGGSNYWKYWDGCVRVSFYIVVIQSRRVMTLGGMPLSQPLLFKLLRFRHLSLQALLSILLAG